MHNNFVSKSNENSCRPYYIYGIHPSSAALSNPARKILEVCCTESVFKQLLPLIQKHKYKIVSQKFFCNLLGYKAAHQGIAVKTLPLTTYGIESLNYKDSSRVKVAILDQVVDPHNLGSIVRSAVAFDISAIILPRHNSVSENSTIAKVAVGALEKVQLIEVSNLSHAIRYLKKIGFWVTGLDSSSSITISKKLDAVFHDKIAFVLGSEGSGIRRLIKEECDFLIKIPTSINVESLNVSHASTIVFYEAFKFLANTK